MARKRKPPQENIEALQKGWMTLGAGKMFGALKGLVNFTYAEEGEAFPKTGWARLEIRGARVPTGTNQRPAFPYVIVLRANPWRKAQAPEWANVFAQALLHVALGHTDPAIPSPQHDGAWFAACEWLAADALRHMGMFPRPDELPYPDPPPGQTPERVREAIRAGGPARDVAAAQIAPIAGLGRANWSFVDHPNPLPYDRAAKSHLVDCYARAIRMSLLQAVENAGASARAAGGNEAVDPNSPAERARRWFVASYPLLGSLAAGFKIIEDAEACKARDIRVAAVEPAARRIYVNPLAALDADAMLFVMAHELLHVGLSHAARQQGRDPYLWNVACDYVINGWLVEMGVGVPPDGLLLDLDLGFERDSAEAVYDRIVRDLRIMRRLGKCLTLRGQGKGDLLNDEPSFWRRADGMDLDAFYRRALFDGLDLHLREPKRGLLPGDLVEEVRALQARPIPWDVKLGQWLDAYFPPLESRRSYARASRRQSSTPDIPRPVRLRPPEIMDNRTFGVVLDVSGSMDSQTLAYAFGAVAAYALSREVPKLRVVQCDARPRDMGYVEPEALLGDVDAFGRGGTVLQPAIDLLMRAENFPKDAPILIVTDGWCERLGCVRDHAFLMPPGMRLGFPSRAPVFHIEPA